VEKITGLLRAAETTIEMHLKEISSLRAEKLSWEQVYFNLLLLLLTGLAQLTTNEKRSWGQVGVCIRIYIYIYICICI